MWRSNSHRVSRWLQWVHVNHFGNHWSIPMTQTAWIDWFFLLNIPMVSNFTVHFSFSVSEKILNADFTGSKKPRGDIVWSWETVRREFRQLAYGIRQGTTTYFLIVVPDFIWHFCNYLTNLHLHVKCSRY